MAGLVGRARARFAVPAVAVTVMTSEGVEAELVDGERVLGQAAHATLDDAFHIGSCSKSVLAVMAAGLVEQVRIAWSTRFFEALPELEAGAQAAYASITLEDPFLCEAGIQPFADGAKEPLPTYEPTIEDPRWAFARDLVARPPASERRQGRFRHLDSNASYTLAALMLERVSGLRYEDHVRRTLADGFGAGVHLERVVPAHPLRPARLLARRGQRCAGWESVLGARRVRRDLLLSRRPGPGGGLRRDRH